MKCATVLQNKRSQVVLLPKDVAFPDNVRDVVFQRDGVRRVIVPADRAWDDFFAAPGVDLGERNQPVDKPSDKRPTDR